MDSRRPGVRVDRAPPQGLGRKRLESVAPGRRGGRSICGRRHPGRGATALRRSRQRAGPPLGCAGGPLCPPGRRLRCAARRSPAPGVASCRPAGSGGRIAAALGRTARAVSGSRRTCGDWVRSPHPEPAALGALDEPKSCVLAARVARLPGQRFF
jgi:hypothetical protein